MHSLKHLLVLGGRQGSQRHGFLDAKDTRMAGAFRAAGIDEGLGFSNNRFGSAASLAQGLVEFNRAAGAPGVQQHNLAILQVRGHRLGDIAVG